MSMHVCRYTKWSLSKWRRCFFGKLKQSKVSCFCLFSYVFERCIFVRYWRNGSQCVFYMNVLYPWISECNLYRSNCGYIECIFNGKSGILLQLNTVHQILCQARSKKLNLHRSTLRRDLCNNKMVAPISYVMVTRFSIQWCIWGDWPRKDDRSKSKNGGIPISLSDGFDINWVYIFYNHYWY